MKRHRRKRMVAMAAAAVLAAAEVYAAASGEVLVDATRCSRHWTTVFTNEVPLTWNWVTNATGARLDIAGMNGTFTTNLSTDVSNCVWRAFGAGAPPAEDVYRLTLTFYKNTETVGALTAQLAVVKGAFGAASVNPVSNTRAWSRVKENVVIPYDAAWDPVSATNALSAQLVIAREDGLARTNAFTDAAGFYGWQLKNNGWGYGLFGLSLGFPGTASVWTAELMRPLDGTAFSLR